MLTENIKAIQSLHDDKVIDLYTRTINKSIMNPVLRQAESDINEIIELINKDIDDPIPLFKADLLPE